jgi:membrane protease subunit (stomatin/prohibitin family)
MGGATPFHCEVYFINKAISMPIAWGTDSPMMMEDPEHKLIINVKSYGDFSLRVADGRKLLIKLVGTVPRYTHEEVKKFFSEIIASRIRDCISSTMAEHNIGALRVNTKLVFMSQEVQKLLTPVFIEYGLELNHFTVSSIKTNDLDEFSKVINKATVDKIAAAGQKDVDLIKINLDAARIKTIGNAQSEVKLTDGSVEAQVNQMKGITEAQKQAFKVAETLAANEGPKVTVAGGDMPVYGMGSVIPPSTGGVSEIISTAMGQPAAPSTPGDFEARLDKLKLIHDKGIITDAQYNAKVEEIMAGI